MIVNLPTRVEMIRGYVDDHAKPICPDCPDDNEKEAELVTVVLEADDWKDDAIPYGAICIRCGRHFDGEEWNRP